MQTKTQYRLTALVLCAALGVGCGPGIDDDTRLRIAREHEMRGDYVTAILELKNFVQSQPGDIGARLMLGRLSLQAGQSAEAIAHLEQARALGANESELLEPLGQAMLANGQFERLLGTVDVDSVAPERRARISLLRGQAHYFLGHYERADDAFRSARHDRSTQADAFAGLGRTAIATQRYDDAEALVEAAVQADPFSVAGHRTRGALRLAQQRYSEALDAFVQAIEATRVRPGSDDLLLARIGLTEAQWRLGQKSRALGNIKDLLDAYPWHPLPRYLRALLAYDSGEYPLATEYAREVLETLPNHPPSLQLLAASQFALGNYSSTELVLRGYLDRHPADLVMRRLLAATHLRMGNHSGAFAVLTPALQQGRDDAEYLALLGRANLYRGNSATAAAFLARAVQLDPDNDRARASYVYALIEAGHLPRAQREMRRLSATEALRHARELLTLELLIHRGETNEALEYAKALRQQSPSNLHAMLALAELAEARGDSRRAMDWLEMAASRNLDAVEPRLLLVRYHHASGNHLRAHALAVEAVQIRPQQAEALVALAREKLDLGQTAAALRTFEEALRASPESGDALLELAAAAVGRGEVATARELLRRAVQISPELMPRASSMVIDVADEGRPAEALDLARELQAAGADLPHGYLAAGDVHMGEKRFADALGAYERALEHGDDSVIALKAFIAAREAGIPEPARTLQMWLERHPGDERVRRMLANAR